MNSLRELFPDQDYGFRMTMRKGPPAEFFRARDSGSDGILAERSRWIAQSPDTYARLSAEGAPLFSEANELGQLWGMPEVNGILDMAAAWEPDILLLSRDKEDRFRLRGGALCFPTGWSLAEKLGRTVEAIHGVVPGLNPAIGRAIDQFLGGLKPGTAFHRDNWGISATNQLNLHPSRRIPAPTLPIQRDQLWLRVEHQAFVALPETRGVLFAIRIALHRLDAVVKDTLVAQRLARALRTMPPEMAAYKGLSQVRDELISSVLIHK